MYTPDRYVSGSGRCVYFRLGRQCVSRLEHYVFHFWTAVFQTWTAVCFWLEPLSWPRPLCVLGLDGCVSGLDRYVFQAWTAYFSGLDRCVSGLDRSVFQAWTGTLCVSGLGRYVFQAWTGPFCVSGLDRYVSGLDHYVFQAWTDSPRTWRPCWATDQAATGWSAGSLSPPSFLWSVWSPCVAISEALAVRSLTREFFSQTVLRCTVRVVAYC